WIAGGTRLLTVLGPPGVGKTRLIHELVRRGVATPHHIVDLRHVDDLTGLLRAIARAPGLIQSASDPQSLARALGGAGPLRLLLDTLEQLVDEAAGALEVLLAHAPELTLIVTSRERLRIPSEAVFDLQPLSGSEAAALFTGLAAWRNRDLRPDAPEVL